MVNERLFIVFPKGTNEYDAFLFIDGIDDPVFAVDAPGPITGEVADKLLRLSSSGIRSFHNFQ